MATLFNQTKQNISLHINNCFKEKELNKRATVKESLTVQTEGNRQVTRKLEYYNLDVIISVGYRVKSVRGTQFRQWATKQLKDYLVQGYAINEKRLAEKEQYVEYLKTGIRILNRAITQQATSDDSKMLQFFAKGLTFLDDYDHEQLDTLGKTNQITIYPAKVEYLNLISQLQSSFSSDIFTRLKDKGFESSIKQMEQRFDGADLYVSIEVKAATLLYLIVKTILL